MSQQYNKKDNENCKIYVNLSQTIENLTVK